MQAPDVRSRAAAMRVPEQQSPSNRLTWRDRRGALTACTVRAWRDALTDPLL